MRKTVTKVVLVLLVGVIMGTVLAAAKPDKRLYTLRKVHLVAMDDLNEDAAVVSCLAEMIPSQLPFLTVVPKEEAEIIYKLKANIPGATTRYMIGAMGGSPSTHIYAELPDGTKLWDDGAKFRRAMAKTGQIGATGGDTGKSIECGLATGLVERLRDAMQEARDTK
jgi:hypothetical protein